MRHAIGRRIKVGVASLLIAGAGAVAVATTAHAASPTATFVKVSDWGTGWEARYTIANGGSATLQRMAGRVRPAGGYQRRYLLGGAADVQREPLRLHEPVLERHHRARRVGIPSASSAPGPAARRTAGSTAPSAAAAAPPPPPGTPGTPAVTGVTALVDRAVVGRLRRHRHRIPRLRGQHVVASATGTSATITGLAAVHHPHLLGGGVQQRRRVGPQSGSVTVTTTGCGTGRPRHARQPARHRRHQHVASRWPGTPPPERLPATASTRAARASATVTGPTHDLRAGDVLHPHLRGRAPTTAAGESARSAPVTGTTTGCPTGPLPKHFLTGYWQNFANPAASCACATCRPTTTSSPSRSPRPPARPARSRSASTRACPPRSAATPTPSSRADVATLHARGKKVILSVGGETGPGLGRRRGRRPRTSPTASTPDARVRLRRRRHRPGERPQPDLHGAGAAHRCAAGSARA